MPNRNAILIGLAALAWLAPPPAHAQESYEVPVPPDARPWPKRVARSSRPLPAPPLAQLPAPVEPVLVDGPPPAPPVARAQEVYELLPPPPPEPPPAKPARAARPPKPAVMPSPDPVAVDAPPAALPVANVSRPVAPPPIPPAVQPVPVAPVASAARPAAAPVFRIVRGELIADALDRWARAADWSLEQPTATWRAPADASFDGDFQQALSALVTQLMRQGAPLQLHLWPANRAALILRTAP